MLAVDLHTREDVLRGEVRNTPLLVSHHRWIRNGALDAVLADGRPMRADEQGDLGAALQHVANDAFVRLACLVANGIDRQNGTNALDDR